MVELVVPDIITFGDGDAIGVNERHGGIGIGTNRQPIVFLAVFDELKRAGYGIELHGNL